MEIKPNIYNRVFDNIFDFELSYETISHKKVSTDYNYCLAIPTGKKFIAWFTYFKNKDVCYLFELNRDKKPVNCTMFEHDFIDLTHGTLLYGTIFLEDENPIKYLIIEDIFYYMGLDLKKNIGYNKLVILSELVSLLQSKILSKGTFVFSIPVLWDIEFDENKCNIIPTDINNHISYPVHHIQYRSLSKTIPYFNVFLTKKINLITKVTNVIYTSKIIKYTMDFNRPIYRKNVIFKVSADLQNDIYHLHAFGKDKELVFYNIAFIPSYNSSIFMNKLFRNIKENENIDFIEESDDEDDFQNINLDKHVDLNKIYNIEFSFNFKFKKWMPIKKIDYPNPRIVHIKQLVSDYFL